MNVRTYGKPPYTVVVLHGGPGAPGYMAPVARELSSTVGVMEPLQTKDTIDGQIAELKDQLATHTDQPVTLVGSSWGAVLALFTAARHGNIVKKLILVGSAVFDAKHSAMIKNIRLSRLPEMDRRRLHIIQEKLLHAPGEERNRLMKTWADMFDATDMYDPLPGALEVIEAQYARHTKIWAEYVTLRDTPGYLADEFSRISVSTVVIHGDYDPHPIEGIRPFLESCLDDVRFHILPKCGHYPWMEKHARERFFDIVRGEI